MWRRIRMIVALCDSLHGTTATLAVVRSSVPSFNLMPLRICFGTQIRTRADAFCLVAEKTSREPIAAKGGAGPRASAGLCCFGAHALRKTGELALLTKKPGKSRASREPRNVDAPDS